MQNIHLQPMTFLRVGKSVGSQVLSAGKAWVLASMAFFQQGCLIAS